MATYHGRGGVVKAGATPSAVGKIQNWEFDETAATADTDSMGDTHYTRVVDLKDARGSVSFVYDDADTGQQELTVGSQVTLELYAGGDASGKTYWTIPAIVTRKGRPQQKDQAVIHSIDWVLNGVTSEDTVV